METQAIETTTQENNAVNENDQVSTDQKSKYVPSWMKGQEKSQPAKNEQASLDIKSGIKEATKQAEPKDKKVNSFDKSPAAKVENSKTEQKTDKPAESKANPSNSNWTITDDGIKFHYKVNGSEYDKSYSYDQIHRMSQKWEGADKRMQDAVNMTRQNQKLIETLNEAKSKKDVKKVLGLLGIENEREFLENHLWENYVKLENMDEKDRELHLTRKQMEEYKAREEERARIEQEETIKRETDQHRSRFQTEIIDTMKRNSDLPQNEWTVSQIAYYMREFMRIGMDKTADEVIPLVKEDYESMVKRAVSTSSIESVVKYLGDDGVEKLRSHIVSKFKNSNNNGNITPRPELNASTSTEKRYMTMDEFKERNKRLLQSRGTSE